MQNSLVPRNVSSPDMSTLRYARDAERFPHHGEQELDADHQFIAMLDACRGCGGLARTHEVIALSRRCGGPDAATLASWIAERKLISFEWQSQSWLPLFQFNRLDMTPQPELCQVLAELGAVYDACEMANWFVQPNPWLADRTPADTLPLDFAAVLNAARADRFVDNY